ncbi:hypothetical protein HZC07_01765 [Candidatus Micrarchaeota archaeon]|nr:hypothetical protein [Candidatus Micrarchaeota archaeon]
MSLKLLRTPVASPVSGIVVYPSQMAHVAFRGFADVVADPSTFSSLTRIELGRRGLIVSFEIVGPTSPVPFNAYFTYPENPSLTGVLFTRVQEQFTGDSRKAVTVRPGSVLLKPVTVGYHFQFEPPRNSVRDFLFAPDSGPDSGQPVIRVAALGIGGIPFSFEVHSSYPPDRLILRYGNNIAAFDLVPDYFINR